MAKKRFNEIDVLRAFGILGVVAIHILTYSLTSPLNKFLWNYLQFVVISFVFCSGFVLAAIYSARVTSLKDSFLFYKKRLIRLVIPFYIYLCAHYLLWIIFPNFFQGLGLKKTVEYFIQSLTFFGGTNLNWLPLLFLQMALLFPLFVLLLKKKKISLLYVGAALIVGLYFSFFHFPYSYYRLVMWIPWSLVLLFSMYLYRKESADKSAIVTRVRYFVIGTIFFSSSISLYFYNLFLNHPTTFYAHKYPPDLYYLFYGTSITLFFLLIVKHSFFQKETIKRTYNYVSQNSYQIFFIHYIILDSVLTLRPRFNIFVNPFFDFVIILILSLLICEGLNRFVWVITGFLPKSSKGS